MTDRAAALRSLRPSRTEGLPPPSPVSLAPQVLEVEPTPVPVPGADGAVVGDVPGGDQPSRGSVDPGAGGGAGEAKSAAPPGPLAEYRGGLSVAAGPSLSLPTGIWSALLQDPRNTCQQMSNERENQPARPLNVNITPGVAGEFDEQCRRLRVKKKDLVELLLRGWLEQVRTDASA